MTDKMNEQSKIERNKGNFTKKEFQKIDLELGPTISNFENVSISEESSFKTPGNYKSFLIFCCQKALKLCLYHKLLLSAGSVVNFWTGGSKISVQK